MNLKVSACPNCMYLTLEKLCLDCKQKTTRVWNGLIILFDALNSDLSEYFENTKEQKVQTLELK